jgi:hypothetical protein
MGCYATYNGNSLQMFWNNLTGPIFKFLTHEDGTDKLSRNVGKELPPYIVYNSRGAQIPSILRQKPDITVFH